MDETKYQLNKRLNTITIQQFDFIFLEMIYPLTKERIVEFDLTNNKSNTLFEQLFKYIELHSKEWRGIVLNFRYQNRYLPQKTLKQLSHAMMQMEDLTVLKFSFGGYYVSKYYAQDDPKAHQEWEKATNGLQKMYDNYKELLEVFSLIISKSPNLKCFCLDFQGLSDDSTFMLRELTAINQSLAKCLQLEEYILNSNHCNIYNYQSMLETFLNSFEFLQNTRFLRKFVLNIAEWEIDATCFEIFGKVLGEYLPHEKQQFQIFQLDHSSNQQVDHLHQTEIKILISSFQKLFEATRSTLKTFYLSLVNYQCQKQELIIFKDIFKHLPKCQNLQKLSLRIQNWSCTSVQVEEEFYKDLRQLKEILSLKQFTLSTFQSLLSLQSPFYKHGQQIIKLMGQHNLVYQKNLLQQKLIQKELLLLYRYDILIHLYKLCNPQDFSLENPKFKINLYH
ncbi:hypothetical protein ABPG72_007095 [Tetrahymena utriculariae]